MRHAIVFDLDGTLWNSVSQLTDYWNGIRQQELPGCRKISREELQSWMGQGVRELAHSILPERDCDAWFPRYLECLRGENDYLLTHGAILYPQLQQTLQALGRQKIELMICSNCGLGYIEAFLQYANVGSYFCDTENPGNTGLDKSQNIRLLLERNHIDAAVYVGDTQKDCDAAKQAGVPFIHAAYGFGAVAAPDFSISTLSQLPQLVESWKNGWPSSTI